MFFFCLVFFKIIITFNRPPVIKSRKRIQFSNLSKTLEGWLFARQKRVTKARCWSLSQSNLNVIQLKAETTFDRLVEMPDHQVSDKLLPTAQLLSHRFLSLYPLLSLWASFKAWWTCFPYTRKFPCQHCLFLLIHTILTCLVSQECIYVNSSTNTTCVFNWQSLAEDSE